MYVAVADADSDVFPEGHPSAGLKLHVTWETDRPDVLNAEAENIGYNDTLGSFYLVMPGECELAAIEPPLPTPLFETTVRIEAADPTGAVARRTVTAKTTWGGGVECPALTAAAVDGATLTLYYSLDLDEDSTPPADRFTVTVGGTAVDLADPDPGADPPVVPVAVSGSTVVLTLAKEVPAGARVTVGYAPPFFGGIGRYVGTFPTGVQYDALELTDEPVANVAGDARGPVLRSATVQGNLLTLVYDELLHPDGRAAPASFYVDEIHGTGGNRIAVTAIEVVGKRVVLTLQRAVDPNLKVALTYNSAGDDTPDSPAIIQDFAGNVAAGIFTPITVVHGPPAGRVGQAAVQRRRAQRRRRRGRRRRRPRAAQRRAAGVGSHR